jgi:hypothetical protein
MHRFYTYVLMHTRGATKLELRFLRVSSKVLITKQFRDLRIARMCKIYRLLLHT